jgi:phage gpG-like protein
MPKSVLALIQDFAAAKRAIKQLQDDIPRIIGTASVRAIKENFRMQGYDSGTGVTPWKPRTPGTDKRYDSRKSVKGSVYQSSNPILKQTGTLYNSIKYKVQGKLVYVGVDEALVPYAKKMNDGGPGKWGKNATDTPARKFMPADGEPPNQKILKAALKKISSQRDKAMKMFKK